MSIPRALVVAVVIGASLVAWTVALAASHLPKHALRYATVSVIGLHAFLLLWHPDVPWLGSAIVLATAGLGGALIGGLLKRPAVLAAAAVAGGASDAISFFVGPTRWLLHASAAGSALRYLTVSMDWGGRSVPVVGLGDMLILSALALGLRQSGAGRWTSFAVPEVGLLAAVAAGLMFEGAPAIPFIAAAVLGYLLVRSRRVRRTTELLSPP